MRSCRRRFQFSVRRLMVAVVAVGLTFGAFRSSFGLGLTVACLIGLAWWSGSEDRFYRGVLKFLIGYYIVCTITLPFVDSWWLGEIPPLAIVQIPKLQLAGWLRTDVVMVAIRRLGWSRGSFSHDYIAASPYALAIAYAIPMIVVIVPIWVRTRLVHPYRGLVALLLIAAGLAFSCTIVYGSQRSLTLY